MFSFKLDISSNPLAKTGIPGNLLIADPIPINNYPIKKCYMLPSKNQNGLIIAVEMKEMTILIYCRNSKWSYDLNNKVTIESENISKLTNNN